jgi:nucleoside-diphosphate-sugar epimerase
MHGGRVLVVGGAGYLGCVLVKQLLARGHEVVVFDRLFFGAAGLASVRHQIKLIAGDMRLMDPAAVEGVDAVINVGGLSNDPTAEYNPEANFEMNAVAAGTLARLAARAQVPRYIFASSCSVYDRTGSTTNEKRLCTEACSLDPRATYARAKLAGERAILELAGPRFCPIVLRMGTLYGFSGRMRYDLVVNSFVKDAHLKGYLTLHAGGQMWRPLVDVEDAARAYILLMEADQELVSGQIFNLVFQNYLISDLANRVQEALAGIGIPVGIRTEAENTGYRNYRVSGAKLASALQFRPARSVEDSVRSMVRLVRESGFTDFDNDKYYNIRWMKLLESVRQTIAITGTIFEMPEQLAGAAHGD